MTSPVTPAIPAAFLCTATRSVMQDPVLAICGHLFDRAVTQKELICPIDQKMLSGIRVIPFAELKIEIEGWKARTEKSAPLESRFAQMAIKQASKAPTVPHLKDVHKAHFDDVHGLIRLSDTRFVSGSKDTTLKIWNEKGDRIQTLEMGKERGYEHWITALSVFPDGCWASGTRQGSLTIWDQEGNALSTITRDFRERSAQGPVCKTRNQIRINCVTPKDPSKGTVYVGTPQYIEVWNMKENQLVTQYPASANDWVYCIEVLENQHLLVVIGSILECWQMNDAGVEHKENLIRGSDKTPEGQRPHISAIKRLEHNPEIVGTALFDGSVRLFDLQSKKIVRVFQEHQKRVWAIENIAPQVLASCADDATIKLWDVRCPNSIVTIGENPGRVSSIMRLNSNILVSGSCPDDVFRSKDKARLSFWDIRNIKKEVA